ncbi:hypothetical protein IAR55_003882 [Kwoniella newhampshirensis]|uniref:Shugoshin C-terminal domain-containing protein n=1 Tax=Kwoniella newhampshirensis TaxID=1651941 RepID=A0AAW0YVZ4_9TREE
MSRQTITTLESQLSSTNHELELATFLNKGILQTNTEYKLRIAELESENIILRKAESRLAKTEDQLELFEKRLEELEAEKEGWQEDMDEEIRRREGLERERDEWEARYWSLRDRLEGVLKQERVVNPSANDKHVVETTDTQAVARTRRIAAPSSKPTPLKPAGLTATPAARPTPSISKATPSGRATTKPTPKRKSDSRPSTVVPQPSSAPRGQPIKSSLSPPNRAPSRAQSKKRRRVQDSPSDDDGEGDGTRNGYDEGSDGFGGEGADHEGDLEIAESDPLASEVYAQQTPPPRPVSPPRSRIQPTSTKKSRTSVPGSGRRKPYVEVKVKAEPVSPGDIMSDSDDDPLAMM